MSSPLLTAAACLFAALNVSAASAQDIVLRRSTVTISEGNDGPRIDVKADRVSFKSLMAKVAAKSGRTVEGGELISRDPEVTALLEDVDLREALLIISGSVGLRATLRSETLVLTEDLGPYPTREEVYTRAESWYLRAMTAAPDSILAPGALWNRAKMWQELPGAAVQAAELFTQRLNIVGGFSHRFGKSRHIYVSHGRILKF